MSDEILTKKQRRDQQRVEKRAQKEHQENRARHKKIALFSALILGTIGMIWAIAASQKGTLVKDITPDPSRGPVDAKVLIKEYSDFQCPACAATAPVLESIVDEYGDKVRFEYNDYPLPQHQNAVESAIAGQCAFAQDAFFDMHDKLFDAQNEWATLGKQEARDRFTQYATDLGLDAAAFTTCLTDGSMIDRVNEDLSEGKAARVNSTPTIFVNGERITNTPFATNLRKAIDDALATAQ